MGRRQFSREFKLEAIKLVRDRGVSVAQAARDLAIDTRDEPLQSKALLLPSGLATKRNHNYLKLRNFFVGLIRPEPTPHNESRHVGGARILATTAMSDR